MALSSIGNAMQSSRLTLRNSGLKKVLKVQNLDAANLFYVLSSFARRMTKSSFEVGEKEKHTLTVDHDWLTKHIRIELDGEKLADEYHYSLRAKKFSFDVGTSEVHKVEVSLGMVCPWCNFQEEGIEGARGREASTEFEHLKPETWICFPKNSFLLVNSCSNPTSHTRDLLPSQMCSLNGSAFSGTMPLVTVTQLTACSILRATL